MLNKSHFFLSPVTNGLQNTTLKRAVDCIIYVKSRSEKGGMVTTHKRYDSRSIARLFLSYWICPGSFEYYLVYCNSLILQRRKTFQCSCKIINELILIIPSLILTMYS